MSVKRGFVFVVCILSIGVLFPALTYAHPKINEFFFITSDGDWIELYNPLDNEIQLDRYYIRDSSLSNKLELEGILQPHDFIVFEWSTKLNNDGDIIRLFFKENDSLIEEIGYGDKGTLSVLNDSHTLGRRIDGEEKWVIFSQASKGTSNTSYFVVPTFTPTPTAIPTPTRTPTPTKIPTPTAIPSPRETEVLASRDVNKSAQVTLRKIPSPTFRPSDYPDIILATAAATFHNERFIDNEEIINSASDVTKQNSLTNIFITTGAALIISCGILIFRNQRREKIF